MIKKTREHYPYAQTERVESLTIAELYPAALGYILTELSLEVITPEEP